VPPKVQPGESDGHTEEEDLVTQQNWKDIEPLVSNPREILNDKTRNQALVRRAKEVGSSRQRLTRLVKAYWKRGMTSSAVARDYSGVGNPGKTKNWKHSGKEVKLSREGLEMSDAFRGFLGIAADYYVKHRPRVTVQQALDYILGLFFPDKMARVPPSKRTTKKKATSEEVLTIHQLKHYLRTQRPYAIKRRRRLGDKPFLLTARDMRGVADRHVGGPGACYAIDATIADIYLVSEFDRTLLVGRPTVYFAVDVYSRLIVGIYVGFEPPSWVAAMMVLVNVATPKVSFCKQYGIDIEEWEWPCHFMPARILADRGELLNVRQGKGVTEGLVIQIENTGASRPELKAVVERRFGMVPHIWKKWAPGYVDKDYLVRGSRDYRKDAALTLTEFTRLLILAVIVANKAPLETYKTAPGMVAEGKAPSPVELWDWGVRNRGGTPRQFTVEEVKRNVLPRMMATVTPKGIYMPNGGFYENERALKDDWFIRARVKQWKVWIAYDVRDLETIYLCDGNKFELCKLRETNPIERNVAGKTLAELLQIEETDSENKREEEKEHTKVRVNADLQMQRITQEGKKKTRAALEAAGREYPERDNIRGARGEEVAANREGESFPPTVTKTESYAIAESSSRPANAQDVQNGPDESTEAGKASRDTDEYALNLVKRLYKRRSGK